MLRKKGTARAEVLANRLHNITETDVSWLGYQTQLSHQIREVVNELIHFIKNTNWETNSRIINDMQKIAKSFKNVIGRASRGNHYLDAKSECKMRKTVDHRLNVILDILESTCRQSYHLDAASLIEQLDAARERNLNLLSKAEKTAINLKADQELDETFIHFLDHPKKTSRGIGPRRREQLDKIRAQEKHTHQLMVIVLMQSLLGNAYEFTDRRGYKVLERALDPKSLDLFLAILNKNYRSSSEKDIQKAVQQAIGLIEKGFFQAHWDIPPHIEEQIQELEEALVHLLH